MKIKSLFIISVCLFCCSLIFANDYSSEFLKAHKNGDFAACETVLKDWQKASPNDPEMMIAYFNYYLYRNAQSGMKIEQYADGSNIMVEGYTYNQEDVKTAISYLDQALKNDANRLDIHFGKCSSLLDSKNYTQACKAIVTVLETSIKLKNKWAWSKGEKIPDNEGEVALFSGINDYCGILKNYVGLKDADFATVIKTIEKLYPNNNIALNWVSLYYSENGNLKKAISVLTKAYNLDKSDYIVLANLGKMYERDNNYKEARKCYETMTKMSDKKAQEYGKKFLEAIKEK
ncbi:MAG: tetratricopeptide repeat protein [Spirochaetaceae bacterium]|nr:tetratricopeptide repeat protein [Spirochaetaceae bacterium]